jgi:hypothetical protein
MNMIGKITIYVSGFSLGSGLGYLLSEYILNKISDEEARIRDEVIEKDIIKHYTGLVADQNDEPVAISEKELKSFKSNVKTVTDYAAISKDSQIKESIDKVASKYLGETAFTKVDQPIPDEPYLISLLEFSSTTSQSTNLKRSLEYYAGDNVLTDETGIVVESVSLIGPNALLNFGKLSDDPDVVYVRNNRLAIDYEIIRRNNKYNELVLGLPVVAPKKESVRDRSRRDRRPTKKVESDDSDEED